LLNICVIRLDAGSSKCISPAFNLPSVQDFEDTKVIIRISKSEKDRQHNDKKKKEKWKEQTTIYKTHT